MLFLISVRSARLIPNRSTSCSSSRILYALQQLLASHPLLLIIQWGFYTAIPTVENGGNHTPGFTAAAKTIEAHKACLIVSKALAGVGVKALTDSAFLMRVSVILFLVDV